MVLKEVGVNTRNWIDSTQDRDYWRPCEYGIEPLGFTDQIYLVNVYIFSNGVYRTTFYNLPEDSYLQAQSIYRLAEVLQSVQNRRSLFLGN